MIKREDSEERCNSGEIVDMGLSPLEITNPVAAIKYIYLTAWRLGGARRVPEEAVVRVEDSSDGRRGLFYAEQAVTRAGLTVGAGAWTVTGDDAARIAVGPWLWGRTGCLSCPGPRQRRGRRTSGTAASDNQPKFKSNNNKDAHPQIKIPSGLEASRAF